jgi:hypothetical protein
MAKTGSPSDISYELRGGGNVTYIATFTENRTFSGYIGPRYIQVEPYCSFELSTKEYETNDFKQMAKYFTINIKD